MLREVTVMVLVQNEIRKGSRKREHTHQGVGAGHPWEGKAGEKPP